MPFSPCTAATQAVLLHCQLLSFTTALQAQSTSGVSGCILTADLAETSLHSNQCKPGRVELVWSVRYKKGTSNLQCGFSPECNL